MRGWSSFLIGSAITAYYLFAAGTLLLGLGATLFSPSRLPWELLAAAALMAAGWAGCTSTAISTVLGTGRLPL